MSAVLPERISRLKEIATNLWWTCRPPARQLFRDLDLPLWRSSQHDPVKVLRDISPERLEVLAHDEAFLKLYDATVAAFDADLADDTSWFRTKYPDMASDTIAYFSAEFALHNSLPIYAGGLGVLAGDICKEACDLGLPFVAVGFMYPQGYFQQRITADGWQEEIYHQLNFSEAPVSPILREDSRSLVNLQMGDRTVHVGAWLVRLGKINLYLLDSNIEENSLQDRQLSNRLYTADLEQRIQQEIVLGIGGTRVLRAMGVNPVVWHANEGHTAFMILERIREEVARGKTFEQAARRVSATTVFTTHTPVPAGHDIFEQSLMGKYFFNYWGSLGLDRESFLRLGEVGDDKRFNMASLALKMSDWRNGVSQLHGVVARRMWQVLWPNVPEDEVPIMAITNGVHAPTWLAPEMGNLLGKYLGKDLLDRYDDGELMARVRSIPNEEVWKTHLVLKRKLVSAMQERARKRWATGEITAQQALAMGTMLDPEALTICYARRFTEYKRPALIMYDLERLKRIIRDPERPVQIIFAGKSHPADFLSKYLLHRVYTLATDREFQGRIAFVEDYDMHMAHYLVQGVDVWLNVPRRLQEASGTSGMKAAINGVLNFSVQDGWWAEGYSSSLGWAIGDVRKIPDPEVEDKTDAEFMYHVLENEIIPLYYSEPVTPHGWVRMMKESMAVIGPRFSARRMLKEYNELTYIPAIKSLKGAGVPPRR